MYSTVKRLRFVKVLSCMLTQLDLSALQCCFKRRFECRNILYEIKVHVFCLRGKTKCKREMAGRQLETLKNIDQMHGIFYTMSCDWKLCEESLESSIEASKKIGDLRCFEEGATFLGIVYYMKGELGHSISALSQALESASHRGDGQTQLLAATSLANVHWALRVCRFSFST